MTNPDGPPLARVSYDRAGLRRTDDEWLAQAWQRAQVVLVSSSSSTPIDADERHVAYRAAADAPGGVRRFLGLVDDVPYFSVTAEPDGDNWHTMREVGATVDDLDAALVISAIGLEQWHERHPRCALCGEPTVEVQAGWIRRCPNDGSQHFPRTDPAVIMLVTSGADDELALLGRGPQWGEGRFSCLAGFVEPGESLEGAVEREVFEEVGLGTRDYRYHGSQPWPFPASLMVGFFARLDGDASITLDPAEMRDAGWFTRDEVRQAATWTDDWQTPLEPAEGTRLRAIPPHFSIARYLIDHWLEQGER